VDPAPGRHSFGFLPGLYLRRTHILSNRGVLPVKDFAGETPLAIALEACSAYH